MAAPRRLRASLVSALLALLAIETGCEKLKWKPDVARLCKDQGGGADLVRGVCLDEATFVSCDTERTLVPCRGPKGCTGKGVGFLHESCDVSSDRDGDLCDWSNRHHDQCSADGKSIIACQMGIGHPSRYAVIPCRGPKGCIVDGVKGEPVCDDSVGVAGEPCEPMSGSCSREREVLTCDHVLGEPGPGHWKVQELCRGPGGCERSPLPDGNGFSIACDDDVAEIGDPCNFDHHAACNLEGTARLECRDHRMVFADSCKCTAVRKDPHTSSITCSGR